MYFLQNLRPVAEFKECVNISKKKRQCILGNIQKTHHARRSLVIRELKKPSNDLKPKERTGETIQSLATIGKAFNSL